MLGHGAIGQFAIGQVGGGETVTVDKWFRQFTDPPRFPIGLKAAQQAAFFFAPSPVVPFGWFEPLSEPATKTRPALRTGEIPAFFMQPAPSPFVATGWYEALSEPVRFPPNLMPSRQQFEARPPQLRPTPKVFATMASSETPDAFLGGARVFVRVLSAEIGVIEMSFTGSQIGIIEQAFSVGTSGIIEQTVAPATGSPIAAITTAHVSIRIV